MKYNKWTVALAAAGVVSLASAAKAEERVNSVMTALSSTSLSGYVDTSAQWNFGTGNAHLPDYKFGGSSKADGFNLNVVQLRIEKPLSEEEWAAGYRVDLWAGPDANVLGTQSVNALGGSDFAVRQAYVALRAPFQNGLDFKVGVFDSIIGYESVESGNNPNYTRSFGHSIEPQTHTGVLMSYRFNDLISASAGVANTAGPVINERAQGPNFSGATKAESYKTYMASVAITAPENMSFLSGSTLYAGIVNGFTDSYGENETSYYIGGTVATPVTGLRLGTSLDVLDIHNTGGETWSIAGYATYQATEKLSLHLRAEYLRDRGDQKFFVDSDGNSTNPDRVLGLTATAQYDLWKNVISRLELRWDHSLSGQETWGGSTVDSTPTLKNEVMLAANIIYKF
ncbi:MAG TPA: outer membrane beta-barrel protein [Methylomirabilota bacterium]|jgi:hypothetical protein|nr:outer membrane beta-barrel protein [Methylomirabilota bacterium]